MVQTISLAAMAAERNQQSQPADPAETAQPAAAAAQSADQGAESFSSGALQLSEAQVAASRFEQSVVAQGVSIAPGILRLRHDDVLAHLT